MGALRLICLVSGLSAAAVCAPVIVRAQAESVGTAPIEVTSGTIAAEVALDVPTAPDDTVTPDVVEDADDPPAVDISALAPARSLRPTLRDAWIVPDARWDEHPHGPRWTSAVLAALRGPGSALLESEPRDILHWCPGYLEATPSQRAAFWTGLISTLAWHESTHQPRAVGGGGQWFGLVQIAPGTARWRDCDVGSGEALLNGAANLRCGIRIMAITVRRDNVVSEGMGGVAADWGPFHSARKREEMRNWVREQSYCERPIPRMRPVMRPAGLHEGALRPAADAVSQGGARPSLLRPMQRPANR